jgi:arginyl-tRNA synthetase
MTTTAATTQHAFFDEVCRATAAALTAMGSTLSASEVADLYEAPDRKGFGDSALPCFPLASKLRIAPNEIAARLAASFVRPASVTEVKAIGGYFNVWYNPQSVASEVLPEIARLGSSYGSSAMGAGRTICMDYSHPNIAKPFGVGHLRSTVIGHALKNIYEKLGYATVGINHLGDWGTQFGKLIVAYRMWGDEAQLQAQPIRHLYDLYVRFHADEETNTELSERARAEFKKLEDGDRENLALWKRFRDASLEEFQRVYRRLGVEFDSYHGEAFYNDHLAPLTERLQNAGIAVTGDDGALVIPIGDGSEPPLLLRKSDGATLYATRDFAAAEYRWNTYHFDRCLYIVGSAQALHFRQLFAALARAGYPWAERMVHVDFGWVKFADSMMSTRRGNIVFLDDVIEEAVTLTRRIIQEKNAELPDADAVAEAVGVGAIVFWQLSVKRQKDVNFDWEDVLSFDGRTGPYLQYTHARICSLLRKWGAAVPHAADFTALTGEDERRLLLQLADWPRRIAQAAAQYEPQIIAASLLDMAQSFNGFYQKVRILDGEPEARPARLVLCDCVRAVMAEGLRLLGLQAPEQM